MADGARVLAAIAAGGRLRFERPAEGAGVTWSHQDQGQLEPKGGGGRAATFVVHDDTLVTGSEDGAVRAGDTELVRHRRMVRDVRVDCSETLVVSASDDGTVRVQRLDRGPGGLVVTTPGAPPVAVAPMDTAVVALTRAGDVVEVPVDPEVLRAALAAVAEPLSVEERMRFLGEDEDQARAVTQRQEASSASGVHHQEASTAH